jgi:uncharacterized protein YjdB
MLLVFALVFSYGFNANTITAEAASAKYVTKVTVAKKKLTVQAKKSATVKVTIKGSKGVSKAYTVKSNKPAIASVKKTSKGVKITGKKAGKATIVITTKAKTKKKKQLKAKIAVTVKAAAKKTTQATTQATTAAPTVAPTQAPTATPTPTPAPAVAVKAVTLDVTPVETVVNGTAQASVKIQPDNATDKTVVYSVDDEKFATIDAKTGALKALKEGTVKVKATASNGVFDEKVVTIKGAATVSLDKKSMSLVVGNSTVVKTAAVTPSDATFKFASSNPSVATIDAKTGEVKALAKGTTTITVTLDDYSGVSDSCVLTVMNDETVIVSSVGTITANGTFTANVAMANPDNAVTDEMLQGTTLALKNKNSGKTVIATYVKGSLKDGVATYAFDSSDADAGLYTIVATDDSKVAIDSGAADDVTASFVKPEIKTGVAGFVYDTDGEPVFGASIACKAGEEVLKTATTDINGYYEIESTENNRLEIIASKEGYFSTSSDDYSYVVVQNNKVTTCNIILENVEPERFAAYGFVKVSDESSEISINQDGIYPVATLYEKVNGEFVEKASTKVGANGYYSFINYNSDITYNEQFAAAGKYFFTNSTNNYFRFSRNVGLDKEKTYKVVVTKELTSSNVKAVYTPAESAEFTLSDTNKVTKIASLTLSKVGSLGGVVIPAGQIKWVDPDHKPTQKKVNITSIVYSEEKGYLAGKNAEVELNESYDASVKDVEVVAKDDITLPDGDYYAYITMDGYASVYKTFTVSGGAAVQIKDVEFSPAVVYNMKMRIKTAEDYFQKENLNVGDSVSLMDLSGAKYGNAYVEASLYQVNGGKEIFLQSRKVTSFQVAKEGNATVVAAALPYSGLVNGNTYRVYFESPVLSISGGGSINGQTIDAAKGTFEFNYNGEEANSVIPEFTTQANITKVKLVSNAQFEQFDAKTPLYVNSISLLDKDKKEIKKTDINRYFTCGNYDSLDEKDQSLVESEIYGGGDLIYDGIVAAFGNISKESYYVQISVNGYEALTVPTSDLKQIELIGLMEGEYSVASDAQFKLLPEVNICGKIKNNGVLITERVDITVINSKGQVAATTTTYDGNYVVANAKTEGNVITVGESYTLVFRAINYAMKSISATNVVDGDNVQADVELTTGTIGVKANIHDDKDTTLRDARVYAQDNKYVDANVEENFVNAKVLEQYLNLTYNGSTTMYQSYDNEAFWSVTSVPKADYNVVVDCENYVYTKKSAGTASHGSKADAGEVIAPRVQNNKVTPVTIRVTKLNSYDLNDGGLDTLKIYSVDSNGTETLVDTQTRYSSKTYSFNPVKLGQGTYKVYVYSRNYYVKDEQVIVSEISASGVTQDVALSASVGGYEN